MMYECPLKFYCKHYIRSKQILQCIEHQWKTVYEIMDEVSIPQGSVYRLMKKLEIVGLLKKRKRYHGSRATSSKFKFQAGNPIRSFEYKSIYKGVIK